MLGTLQRGAMGLHTRGMGKLVREATSWRQVGQPLGSLLVRNGHQRGFATDGIQQRFDVLVIGGGIMGSSTAHWLARKTNGQLKVCVVEPDPSYSTSATTLSVGGLRQQFSLRENIRIGLYARDFMRSYPSSMAWGGLDPESLPDVNFQPHGYLFLATKAGEEVLARNQATQSECGASTVMLDQAELKQTFPWLNIEAGDVSPEVTAGCYGADSEGWFDPWALLQAFKLSAQHGGVEYIQGEVTQVNRNSDGNPSSALISNPSGDKEIELSFDKLVIAAGGDSGKVGRLVGIGEGEGDLAVPIPVEKRKRFVYVPHCPEGPGLDCPLVIDPTGVYFRREGLGGNYLCGQSPTEEQEPDNTDLTNVDMDWFDEQVWPVMAQRVEAFERLKVRTSWAGNYDYNTWDQNGLIGKHRSLSNTYMACGFSGHGIQQGPAVGRGMAELLLDGSFSSLDLSALSFDRVLDGRMEPEIGPGIV